MMAPASETPDLATPVFAAPWQAQIFALVVALEKAGHFDWSRFQALLTAAIAEAAPAEQGAEFYYRHWLAAADRLFAELGLTDAEAVRQRQSDLAAKRAADHHHH